MYVATNRFISSPSDNIHSYICALAIFEAFGWAFECAFFLFWMFTFYSGNNTADTAQNWPVFGDYVVSVLSIGIANALFQ